MSHAVSKFLFDHSIRFFGQFKIRELICKMDTLNLQQRPPSRRFAQGGLPLTSLNLGHVDKEARNGGVS